MAYLVPYDHPGMERQEMEQLLKDTDRSLIEVYFELQGECEKKYGLNTIVLMEVGSFFEVYGVDSEEVKIGKPKEVAEILNLQLTRRNKMFAENSLKNPLLAGFPTAAFERYMTRLIQENKYTIVVVRQEGVPPKITRYIEKILSPGVNFDYSLDHDENCTVSLVVDQNNELYSVGYAAIDVTTGKTFLQEVHSTSEDKMFALDEVFRLLQSYRTSEIILTCVNADIDEYEVRQYLEIFDTDVKSNTKRLKVSYQNELFKQTYIIKSFLTPIEFLDLENKPLASESLAILVDFIIDHDYQVIQKLEKPTLFSSSEYLYLGNNPLEQLNITSRDPQELTLTKLLNKTVTSMGARLFKERLFHPLTNALEIESRYDLAEIFRGIEGKVDTELRRVYDLERITRRIRLQRLHPFELNFLFDSLQATERIIECISGVRSHEILENFLKEKSALEQCLVYMQKTFDLDETAKVTSQGIEGSIFQNGFHGELDELIAKKQTVENKLHIIREKIIEILQDHTGKEEGEYVEIKQLEKEGHYLSLTRNRFALIEKKLKQSYVSLDGTVYAFSDFSFKPLTTSVKITAPIIDSLSEEIVFLQSKIIALTRDLYVKQLSHMEDECIGLLLHLTEFISKIDVAVSTIKTATQFRLIRPEIEEEKNVPAAKQNQKAFLEIQEIRHLLVESREENGIYVPNDVFLGARSHAEKTSLFTTITQSDINGILLYGINSSGKSSFMKSLGMAVVLAQSGMFVPAESMRFTLFTELFTRILAQDNFEKGLSSFGVEMMELKNIFNRCTPRSLILGDEISHGTETLSALAIVSATIEHLAEKNALFVFTTHLHQLCNLDRIQNLKQVVSVHLSVSYDATLDKLIFQRKLQEGSGSSIYGLEFAESLHIDKDFMKRAQTIRKELAKDYEELELLTKKQRSKYHSDLYISTCAICKNSVEDTHHIVPQEVADSEGNIGHFHKNHKYNLLPLCKDCHNRVHEGKLLIRGFVMTSHGLEIDYLEE